MTETTAESTTPLYILEVIDQPTSLETCDKCGESVYAACMVVFLSGARLSFCGHHGKRFGYEHPVPDSKLQGSAN